MKLGQIKTSGEVAMALHWQNKGRRDAYMSMARMLKKMGMQFPAKAACNLAKTVHREAMWYAGRICR